MPKIAKKFLIVVGGVLLLLGLALLFVNLYLQSEGVQNRIREAAASSLGAQVNTGGSLYTPWGGFVIKNVSVPSPVKDGENILEADSLRIRFALLPLLQGRLLVRQVILANPVMIARQDKDGNWVALVPPAPKQQIPVTVPDSKARPGKSFQVTLEKIAIQGARAVFLDRKGRVVMRFEKADFEATIKDDRTSSGTFDIGNLEIANTLRPRKIGGPFTWDGRVLDMPAITGNLAGGELMGHYRLETGEDANYQLGLEAREVKLKKLAEDAGGSTSGTGGVLNGKLDLNGDPRNSESTEGLATIDLVEAKFTPVDFLVQFGQMFGIEELQRLDLSEATSRFVISGGEVQVERIHLKSENLILMGAGTAGFDGALDIDAELHVNKKLQKSLRAVMGKNFEQTDDPDYKKLEFEVTNTLSNPRTDLLDKLIGAKVGQDLGGLLQNIFRQTAPKKEKTKESEDSSN